LRALPNKTSQLFEKIKVLKPIENFVLVGGTALALRLQHRYSEDLDFMTTGKLNRPAINEILGALRRRGSTIKQIRDFEAALEFEGGGNPDDYSLRFRVDDVKLDFFSKQIRRGGKQYDVAAKISEAPVPEVDTGHIRVVTEDCVFSLKAQVLDERTTVRDFFDLRVMLSRNNRTIRDLFREAVDLGLSPDHLTMKVLRARQRADDPPVNPVADAYPDVPIEFEALKQWLVEQINEFERWQAEQVARGKGAEEFGET